MLWGTNRQFTWSMTTLGDLSSDRFQGLGILAVRLDQVSETGLNALGLGIDDEFIVEDRLILRTDLGILLRLALLLENQARGSFGRVQDQSALDRSVAALGEDRRSEEADRKGRLRGRDGHREESQSRQNSGSPSGGRGKPSCRELHYGSTLRVQ